MTTKSRYKVASVDELREEGSRAIADIHGQEIAVFHIDGEYYAVANYCAHQAGPLCQGDLTGHMVGGDDGWEWNYEEKEKAVTCPWHGWKFDVTTGRNIKDERYAAPTYDVEVEDGDVYVLR